MSDDKFDAIVVGAGVAGSVAALVMARAGLDVLVIERGDSAGCKNMPAASFVPTHLKQSFRGFAVSAPVERKVTRENLFLTEESAVTLGIFTASSQMFRSNTHLIPYCVIVWTRG